MRRTGGRRWSAVLLALPIAAACSLPPGEEGESPSVGEGENELQVSPSTGLSSFGEVGGPFLPASQDYVLTNTGTGPLDWSASADEAWILLSDTAGQLQTMEQATVTVSIDPALANGLAAGSYTGSVSLTDATHGTTLTRDVRLSIVPPGVPGSSPLVAQFGITWTFDQPYPVGQFANGDWWVVGPVTIVDIDPATTSGGGRTTNGSMVNPSPTSGWTQGYDSAMYAQYKTAEAFDPALNVAAGVSVANPLALPPGSSLVSTISVTEEGARPQLRTAAVLTVLASAPPDGSFRPPYAGTDKTVRYNEAQLNTALLATLPRLGSTPDFSAAERWFERPWLDHVPDWVGRYTHPADNMPDFGREMADQVGNAALMLQLDFTDAEKKTLLVRFVQLGIDFYGIVQDGGHNNWPAGGGHHSGRKWPILFAGLLLGDAAMSGIGNDPIAFNEDDQTFHVEETSPGVYNYGEGGYTASHVGMPEWGTQHWKQINRGQNPTMDAVGWFTDPYRLCCTANVWWGSVLAARIMGARSLWNHDALFDYQDRYLQENLSRGILDWRLSWSAFPLRMWETYRASF